jgi:LPS-assembly lipoprotein
MGDPMVTAGVGALSLPGPCARVTPVMGYSPAPGRQVETMCGIRTRWWAALFAAILLGGCGFHLRGVTEIPKGLIPLYIQAGPGSHIAPVLYQTLRINGVPTTMDSKVAAVVLRIYSEGHGTRVSALNAQGKVIGDELSFHVTFDAVRRDGLPFLERQSIENTRDYVNPQVEVLGKSEEAEMIRRDLEQDMAEQILGRLRARLTRG